MLRDKPPEGNKSFALPPALVQAHLRLERRNAERRSKKQHAIDQQAREGVFLEPPPDDATRQLYRRHRVLTTSDKRFFTLLKPVPDALTAYISRTDIL